MVRLFTASATQWRFAGLDGAPTGLDYSGVEVAARMSGIEVTEPLLAGLRIMERAAIDEALERRRR